MDARSFLCTLALAACAGCGGAGEPSQGVLHLDLKLADKSSASRALASALAVREVRPDARAPESLGAWTVLGGRLAGVAQGRGARLVASGDLPASLRLAEPFAAADFTRVELVVEVKQPADARVSWSGSGGSGALVIEAQPDDRPRIVSFAVGTDPTWQGTIETLDVTPADLSTYAVVHAVRLVPMGFHWGSEPLAEESRVASAAVDDAGEVTADAAAGAGARVAPADEPADAGLRQRGYETRRAWPSDVLVPLFARVASVPRGGVLSAAVAPGDGSLGKGAEPIFAAVDARRPGGAWRRLWEEELPTGRTVMSTAWRPFACDLAEYAGEELELRFLAAGSALPDAGDEAALRTRPTVERVLWGAPVVLGEPPEDPRSRRPSVVLITLDTTRADAFGQSFTPFLDAFGREAIVFTNAWSSCNSTTPSHASILTGLHVEEHGAITNYHMLGPEVRTLAEELRDAGYYTAAAVSVPHIEAGVGFGQGFDAFALAQPGAEVDGAHTIGSLERWLDEWDDLPRRPFFLWVHLFDPHTPYSPPEDWVAQFLEQHKLEPPPKEAEPPTIPVYPAPRKLENVPLEKRWLAGVSSLEYSRFVYALGVAYADHLCGELLGRLTRDSQLEHAAVVIAADHGEALGEHNVWFNHAGLFRETLQVPLILRLPDGPRGLTVDAPVSTIDIAPTILHLCAVPNAPQLSGEDLARAARGELPSDREIWFAYNGLHQVGFRKADEHFVTTLTDELTFGVELVDQDGKRVPRRLPEIPLGKSFLYDPSSDPALEADLADANPAKVEGALERLARWRASLQAARVERRGLSEAEKAGLAGLGYAGDG